MATPTPTSVRALGAVSTFCIALECSKKGCLECTCFLPLFSSRVEAGAGGEIRRSRRASDNAPTEEMGSVELILFSLVYREGLKLKFERHEFFYLPQF